MRSTGLYAAPVPRLSTANIARQQAEKPIRVRALSERDRRPVLDHFLALDEHERLMRFGSVLPDERVTRYVQRLDFNRDAVFGVYDDSLVLLGVGHLAFAPREAFPQLGQVTSKSRVAEFGMSVLARGRGIGIGSRLFERAAARCRNEGVDALYVHCLASSRIMMHIARKAGMEIHREHGEADAFLTLPPAGARSALKEAVEEQLASFDYSSKVHKAAFTWRAGVPRFRQR